MRILHVVLTRGFAGTERAVADVCNALGPEHVNGVVIPWRQARRRSGRLVGIAPYLNAHTAVLRIPRRWFALAALSRQVRAFEPDIVHAHLEGATRLVAQLETPAAKVATLHLDVLESAYLQLDAILCVARWQHRLAPPDFAGRMFYCPNSIAPHRRLDSSERTALRAEFGAGDREFLVGAVGSLIERKGFDTLIDAFRSADLPNARLAIIGEGRDRAQLQARCDARVTLAGFRRNVRDYYQAFDLFVCPSRREAFGLVLIEALEAGVPVLASDAEGCREILGGAAEHLFPVGDVYALRTLLIERCAAPRANPAIDLSGYSVANARARLLDAYAAVLASVRRRRGVR